MATWETYNTPNEYVKKYLGGGSFGEAMPKLSYSIGDIMKEETEKALKLYQECFIEFQTGMMMPKNSLEVREIRFNGPATIIFWEDGTKTIVKCDDRDDFDFITGIALCFMKKALGNKGNYNDVFRKFISDYDEMVDHPEIKKETKKTTKRRRKNHE